MEAKDVICLRCDHAARGHVKDNLYWMLAGNTADPTWQIDREKLADAGFRLVRKEVNATKPSSIVFHHYPSGSSVLVVDYPFKSSVEIFGQNRDVACKSLVSLVEPSFSLLPQS